MTLFAVVAAMAMAVLAKVPVACTMAFFVAVMALMIVVVIMTIMPMVK